MPLALITGSTKGLGYAFANHLATQGYTIALHYHKDKPAAEQAFERIKTLSPKSILLQGDLRHRKNCKQLLTAIAPLGNLDLLINNIGNFIYRPVENWTETELKDVIESNLYSTFFMMQEALRHMKGGHIVNLGCVGCENIVTRKHTTPYYIAKFGVVALTRHFDQLSTTCVHVLLPGVLETAHIHPRDVEGRVVTLSQMCSALDTLLQSNSGQLLEVNNGWRPSSDRLH